MSSIRSILGKLSQDIMTIERLPMSIDRVDAKNKYIDQALKEIEEAIKREVIGENEKDEAGWNEQIRNGLRAEQRNSSKELFK